MSIKCCNGCVPPKRHLCCHDHCPDFSTEKIMNIVTQAPAEKEKRVSRIIAAQKIEGVERAYRRSGKHKKGRR